MSGTKKKSGALLGAAFLMATSAIGPRRQSLPVILKPALPLLF